MWDSEDEKNVLSHDFGREEVKRVKENMCSIDTNPVASKDTSLNLENSGIEGQDLNFKRQIKKKVHNYKYKTVYNVGKTCNPYLLTRNSVVMMLEENLGVEIIVQGTYKPEELNGDTEDEDALLFEISAPTPNRLQEAMFRFASIIRSLPSSVRECLKIIGKHVYRDGVRYWTCRLLLKPQHVGNQVFMDEIHREMKSISRECPEVRIRGRFSGCVEPCLNEEADEHTYIQITARFRNSLVQAEDICRTIMSKYG